MKTINATTLAEMTISLLERTAMVLVESAAEGEKNPAATRFARINYWGPSKGKVILAATDGLLSEVASSLLSIEPSEVDIEKDCNDAIKEIANTVGGSVILALSGDQCEYSLGLPEIVTMADVPASPQAECTVVADGGTLHVVWCDDSAVQTCAAGK